MPWVYFTSDHEWRVPGRRAIRTFKEGAKLNVPRACADDAEAKGNGYRTEGRSQSEAETSDNPEPETTEVFLTDEPEGEAVEEKKQSIFSKLTGTADREPG